MNSPKHIHFMGIGGSGMSAAAQIAKAMGFTVTGCNMDDQGDYLAKVRSAGIPVAIGHSQTHLQNIDLLVVTPAVFFQSANEPEYLQALRRNSQDEHRRPGPIPPERDGGKREAQIVSSEQKFLMTWQQFTGKYLTAGKDVIAVAGTHGKSTTTALAGLLLETARVDPTVIVGATVPSWHSNARTGSSKYLVIEADEYYHNFLYYHPDVIILNNIEMDHP
jgi:UDP-N-acetylmuramate--alanine ligase